MGLADLALARASLAEDEFEWRGSESEVAAWENALDKAAMGEPSSLSAPARCVIRISPDIWVNARVGDGLPDVTIFAAQLDSAQHGRLNEIVQRHLAGSQEMPLFDIIVELQEVAADIQPPTEPPRAPTPPPQELVMARIIFWAHHLVAPSKRRQLARWCPELRVWGVIKLGCVPTNRYPGYLCFEGEEGDVQDIASRVRHMQWHALSLRTEQTWSHPGPAEAALRDCPLACVDDSRTLRTSCTEIEDMGALVARCVAANRLCAVLDEGYVVSALGLRTAGKN